MSAMSKCSAFTASDIVIYAQRLRERKKIKKKTQCKIWQNSKNVSIFLCKSFHISSCSSNTDLK